MHLIHFGRHSSTDYTLTFCLEAPESVRDFLQSAPTMFKRVNLRSSAQIDSDTFEYVYTVYPRDEALDNLVGILRNNVSGISRISLIRPETFVDV